MKETGEIIDYDGDDFMFGRDLLNLYQNFDYKDAKMKTTPLRYVPVVEDIARLINEILDKQEKVNSHNITFYGIQ
jgi:hypothetical protein